MASGLAGFLGLGRRQKVNQTQAYQAPPAATSSPLWGQLSNFATQRMNGQGTGFGEDFTSAMTNPTIQASQRRFQQQTVPMINQQFASRGLSGSAGGGALATDTMMRAGQEQQSNVDQLLAQFDYLNRVQKKTDEQQGVNLGQNLQNNFLTQGNNQASQFNAAEAGNTARTSQLAATNNANDLARQNNMLGSVQGLLGNLGQSQGGQSFLGQFGLNNANSGSMNILGKQMPMINYNGFPTQTSTYGQNNVPQGFEGRPNPGGQNQGGNQMVQMALQALPFILAAL